MPQKQPSEREIRAEIARRKKLWVKLQAEARQAVSVGIELAKQRGVNPRTLKFQQQNGFVICYRLTSDEQFEPERRGGMATLKGGKLTPFHPDSDPTYQNYPELSNQVLEGFLEQAIRLVVVSLGIEEGSIEIVVPKR